MPIDPVLLSHAEQELHCFFAKHAVKGFLHHDEGMALYQAALAVQGPCLEIGSYCGKSAVYIAMACQLNGTSLYAVDHHRGSEEHQPGEAYHDPDLFERQSQRVNTLPALQRTLALADLEDTVLPIVASSAVVVLDWATPLALVFIDGGHSHDSAHHDCTRWADKLSPGGVLAVHDIFAKPEEGGQGPYLAMQAVLQRGDFTLEKQVRSLALLRKQ